jgi:methionine synthase II (cobalamin-independent)
VISANTKLITKNTTIEEIVMNYPDLITPLKQFGITCVACGEPIWGTLAENAYQKNINELDVIIDKLNRIILASDG